MQQVKPNADPAPSRLSYRMQRWLLTPGFQLALRAGVPFCVTLAAVSLYFSDQDRRDTFNLAIADLRASIEERPEFMVNVMAIDGASRSVAQDIREVVPIDFPVSSFDLDLEQVRAEIAGLNPVREVSVRIRPGGVLQVDVTERVPALVWRSEAGLDLVDATGVPVAEIFRRAERPDLPLIVGTGAADHTAEALALVVAAAPMADRLRGLVRVGERRWDVVLDRDQRILLPETGAVQELERVLALSAARELLERDVTIVDMRLPERPTLRMSRAATDHLWHIQQLSSGE